MRAGAFASLSAAGLVVAVAAAAAPETPPALSRASNVVQVRGGCGWESHRHHGYCVSDHHYRRYAYRPYYNYPYYGYYPLYPNYGYYGGYGYEPWNRPSPSDHVANQLNAQQLGRWGY